MVKTMEEKQKLVRKAAEALSAAASALMVCHTEALGGPPYALMAAEVASMAKELRKYVSP